MITTWSLNKTLSFQKIWLYISYSCILIGIISLYSITHLTKYTKFPHILHLNITYEIGIFFCLTPICTHLKKSRYVFVSTLQKYAKKRRQTYHLQRTMFSVVSWESPFIICTFHFSDHIVLSVHMICIILSKVNQFSFEF